MTDNAESTMVRGGAEGVDEIFVELITGSWSVDLQELVSFSYVVSV